MTSIKIFLMFVPVLSFLLLGINFLLAPHKPYKEKKTPFECGYHSFLAPGVRTKQSFRISSISRIWFASRNEPLDKSLGSPWI